MDEEYKRPFIQEAYDEFDMNCKKALLEVMSQRGFSIIGNIEEEHFKKYDLKFFSPARNQTLSFENEFRGDYAKIRDMFPTVHVPIRKKGSQCDYYVVWGENYHEMALIKMDDVKRFAKHPVKVTCKKAAVNYGSPVYDEEFIDVPKKFVQFFRKQNNNLWKRIK